MNSFIESQEKYFVIHIRCDMVPVSVGVEHAEGSSSRRLLGSETLEFYPYSRKTVEIMSKDFLLQLCTEKCK